MIDKFKDLKVLVVGDIIIDEYELQVADIPPNVKVIRFYNSW